MAPKRARFRCHTSPKPCPALRGFRSRGGAVAGAAALFLLAPCIREGKKMLHKEPAVGALCPITVKWCPSCQEMLSVTHFYKNVEYADGYRTTCRRCMYAARQRRKHTLVLPHLHLTCFCDNSASDSAHVEKWAAYAQRCPDATISHLDGFMVYALTDPCDSIIRYIGLTSNPRNRYAQHLQGMGYKEERKEWVAQLHRCGMRPLMKHLATIQGNRDESVYYEAAWIYVLLHDGVTLLNRRVSDVTFSPGSIAECLYQGLPIAPYIRATQRSVGTRWAYPPGNLEERVKQCQYMASLP